MSCYKYSFLLPQKASIDCSYHFDILLAYTHAYLHVIDIVVCLNALTSCKRGRQMRRSFTFQGVLLPVFNWITSSFFVEQCLVVIPEGSFGIISSGVFCSTV